MAQIQNPTGIVEVFQGGIGDVLAEYSQTSDAYPRIRIKAAGNILVGNGTVPPATDISVVGGGVTTFNARTGVVVPGIADYLAVAYGGLTGATAATRFVGATAAGAPTTGTFAAGDFVIDQTGKLWICTAPGTPGTWSALSIDSAVVHLAGAETVTGPKILASSAVGTTPLAVKAAVGQTADLMQWQDSTGAVLSLVTPTGRIGSGASAPVSQIESSQAAAQVWQAVTPNTWSGGLVPTSAITATNRNPGGYDPVFVGRAATSTGVIKTTFAIGAQGVASWLNTDVTQQVSDLYFVLRDTTDTLRERMRISASGAVNVATSNFSGGGALNVAPLSAGTVGQVVRGAAGQTGDLQQWQDSTGTPIHRFAVGGVGLNGNTAVAKAAAIATPNAQSASYVQADVTSLKTAIDAIRVALQNIGITA